MRMLAVALVMPGLALTACSDNDKNDQGQTDKTQTQVEKAKENLAQAKEDLEKAQQEAKKEKAEKKTDNDGGQKSDSKKQATQKKPETAKKSASSSHGTSHSTKDQKPVCQSCGTVSAITPVERHPEHGSGVGAAAGGIAGGVIGSQIGHGSGKTIAEIAGVVGGIFAGNSAEKYIRKETVYKVSVAMDTGTTRSVVVKSTGGISRGTRVRVQGNNLVPMR